MRCTDCNKTYHEFHSIWDRVRLFLFGFFHEDISDVRTDFYTKGFGEGYREGYKCALERKFTLELDPNEVLKRWTK